MKQTAVEWLQQALITKEDADNYNLWAFNKAKAMEKEQIIDTYKKAQVLMVMDSNKQAEQYYNETFKSE